MEDVAAPPSADPSANPSEDTGAAESPLSWNEAIQSVPPEIAVLMKSMQADYTRKTQAVAQERKAMQAQLAALSKGRQALAPKEAVGEFDPWNEDSVSSRIEAEVARRLSEVLAPVEESYQSAQADAAYDAFIESAPDLQTDDSLRSEVAVLLREHEHLSLEHAYKIVKAGRLQKDQAKASQVAAARTDATRKAAMATGAPRRPGAPVAPSRADIKKMSNSELARLVDAMVASKN